MASFIRGNGGNSVVCENRAELLDIVEARILFNFHFDVSDLEARALLRAQRYIPQKEINRLEQWISEWATEVQWLNGIKLGQIQDSFDFINLPGCTIEQTVLARDPLPGEARYLVREDLYSLYPSWEKKALVWHEVLYRNLILKRKLKPGNKDSIFNSETARKMVAALFADESESWSEHDWRSLFEEFYQD
jgi:hypothetical protein